MLLSPKSSLSHPSYLILIIPIILRTKPRPVHILVRIIMFLIVLMPWLRFRFRRINQLINQHLDILVLLLYFLFWNKRKFLNGFCLWYLNSLFCPLITLFYRLNALRNWLRFPKFLCDLLYSIWSIYLKLL